MKRIGMRIEGGGVDGRDRDRGRGRGRAREERMRRTDLGFPIYNQQQLLLLWKQLPKRPLILIFLIFMRDLIN